MKILIGLLLVPVCVAATRTLIYLIDLIRPDSLQTVSYSAWALLIGFLLWIALYYCTPRPIRTYVLAHELTHALWGWLMGARVSRIKVSRKGGSVTLSKTNVFITLAPYFFPFYTVCLIVLFQILSLFFDLRSSELFWLAMVGFTWGFHLTFTVSTLMRHQTDIAEYGRVFSYAVIYLLNVLGIALWIVAVASPTLDQFVGRLGTDLLAMWAFCKSAGIDLWYRVSR